MAGLTPKHYKALDLISENSGLSTREVAQACGFSLNYMRDLIEGERKAGPMGQLFKTELKKVYKKISFRILM